MIISKTPLRVSLFGGSSDIRSHYQTYFGHVVSCTIDKYIYVIVKKRFDKLIVLNYSEREKVESVKDIKHSIIRECLKWFNIENGLEITSIADIPSEGSGLGSSSAFAVGLIHALSVYTKKKMSIRSIAELACKIEINILENPIGKQDQYACAFGGLREYMFFPDESVMQRSVEGVELEQLSEKLCYVFHWSN